MPNSLRFKIRIAPDDPDKIVGVIFHVPCLPPPDFSPVHGAIVRTWQAVHALLDELGKPASARKYHSIKDNQRKAKLKPQLDSIITLTRIQE